MWIIMSSPLTEPPLPPRVVKDTRTKQALLFSSREKGEQACKDLYRYFGVDLQQVHLFPAPVRKIEEARTEKKLFF